MNIHKYLLFTYLSLILLSCFEEQETAPNCFASQSEISFDARSMALRYQNRRSAYCSYDTQSCVEVWTGLNREDLVKNPEYLIQYPYLALLDKKAVSPSSLYSECYLPTCQSPECECETLRDCEEGSLCVGLGFLDAEQSQKTRCLSFCDTTSSCLGDSATNTYCETDDCLTPSE